MIAWAICDTGKGRHEPRPMPEYCYTWKVAAEGARKRLIYPSENAHYSVRQVRIEIIEENENEHTTL